MAASAFAAALVLTAGPAAATDLHVHGLLDLVAAGPGDAYVSNRLMRGDSPLDAYGLRVYAGARLTPSLEVYSEFVLRDATSPYVDGAYVVVSPLPAHDAHLLAGKVPWAIGTYPPRSASNRNPLIGAPLMYQYHSTLLWYEVVPSADALFAPAGAGQTGVDYFGYPEGRGMALVDNSYWDVGLTIAGSERPLEYALGVVAGTPGWGSTSEDENSGKSVLGRIGLAPLPGMRIGVSGAYGPYLDDAVNRLLPQGHDANDYHQKIGMADLELLAGHIELRAEGARNVWETPTVGDLGVTSGYGELKYTLLAGAFAAGRYDVLRFDEIADATGARHTWDANVARAEAGLGYRFNRDALLKVLFQDTRLGRVGLLGPEQRYSLVAAQLSVGF